MPEPESLIVDEVGAEDANSYIDVTDADAYFTTHPSFATWDVATDEQKERALIQATRLIDTLNFKYERANPLSPDEVQCLAFPRTGSAQNERHIFVDADGEYIIPRDILYATCEQALALIVSGGTSGSALADLKAQGVQSQSIGDVSVTFTNDAAGKTVQESKIDSNAMTYLITWIDRTVRIARG